MRARMFGPGGGFGVVLGEPASEWDIGINRVVDAVGGACSQELGSDWVDRFEQMGDGHFIFGFQPAIAVAEPDDFSSEVRIVAAARVPDATIDEYRAARFNAKRFCTGRVRQSVFGTVEFVVEVRTGHDQRVASTGFGDIRKVEPNLQRQARPRVDLNFVVDSHAVLVPGHRPCRRVRIRRRSDIQM